LPHQNSDGTHYHLTPTDGHTMSIIKKFYSGIKYQNIAILLDIIFKYAYCAMYVAI